MDSYIREQALQINQALQTAVLARLSNITQNLELIRKLFALLTQYISRESTISGKLSLLDEVTQQCVIYAVILICLCKTDVDSSLYTLQMFLAITPKQRPVTVTMPPGLTPEQVWEAYKQAVAIADEALCIELTELQKRIHEILGHLTSQSDYHMEQAMRGDEDPCQENTLFREIVTHMDTGNSNTETLVQLCQSALTLERR